MLQKSIKPRQQNHELLTLIKVVQKVGGGVLLLNNVSFLHNFSGEAGLEKAEKNLSPRRRTTDKKNPIYGRSIFILVLFSRFGHMSDFFVSQKKLSRQNFMLLAWLEEISHYQHSSPVYWQKYHIFRIKMKLNVDISIFLAFGLIFLLKRSISFYRSSGTAEPDQSILILVRNIIFLR